MKKKGQVGLNVIVPAVLTLVLGAFVLVFGLIMLDNLKDNTATYSRTVTNESIVLNSSGCQLVSTTGDCGFSGFSVSQVINTSGIILTSANYTVYSYGAVCNNTATTVATSLNWNVTYGYNYGLEACTASNETIAGLGAFADYFDLIVLAIVISVIISLLLVVFSLRKDQ